MKNVSPITASRTIALMALILTLFLQQTLHAQLPAPTNVTATPSTINLGQSSNLNATSAGNDIRWYTVSSAGTSLGTSGSGANFSVSPTSNASYYAESYKASSSVDVRHNTTTQSQKGIQFRMKATSGSITVTGVPVTFSDMLGSFTVSIYKMQSAYAYDDLFSSTNWTSMGNVTCDGSTTYIDLPSDITIPNGSTYSLYMYANGIGYFGGDKFTCTEGGYPSCTMSDTKIELSWIGGATCYTGPFVTCSGSTAYSNTAALPNGGIRYSIPEQTSSSRTSVSVTVNQCANPGSAGTISSNQTICNNTIPAQITGTTPTGQTGTLQYQWQNSANNSSWADITGATAVNYTPEALTTNTYFRRRVKVTCLDTWLNASSVMITVRQLFAAGSILTTGESINYNGNPSAIGNNAVASGGDGTFTYSWEKSTTSDADGFSNIAAATNTSYDPPGNLTETTWYRRLAKDGTCNTTPTPSTGVWKVTVLAPSVTTTPISSVKTDSATSGGKDLVDLDQIITAKGIVWNTSSSPTTALTTKTSEPIVTGSEDANFTSFLTGLSVNTRYYTRAYIVNSFGTFYGNELDFYTTANVPNAPTVNSPAITSLNVAINANGNPAATTYAIYDTVTGNFVQANGILGASAVWQTEALWEVNASNTAKTVTNLLTNSLHTFKVKARNGSDTETNFSGLTSLYTLVAIPGKPTVNAADTTSINVAINANGNPNTTGFAIYERKGNKYVQANGTLGASAVWQTEVIWETDATNTAKKVNGLFPNTEYTFLVKARNGDNTESALSAADSLFTLANVPLPPTIINPTANSLDLVVRPNGNSSTTLFAIQDSVNGTFVQVNGTRSGTIVWQTASAWDTTTVTNLIVGSTNYFRVKAKNGNDVQTGYGLATAGTTCLNPATGGVIGTAQIICYNTSPVALSETTAPTGFAGTLEYQWQSSSSSDTNSFSNITGATTSGYTPGNLTDTTWYLRLVKVTCKAEWVKSNILKITVHPNYATGSIEITGDTICYGGDALMIDNLVLASGGDGNISYQWQSSVAGPATGYSNISGATASSYDPPSGLTDTTWYRRMTKDGACNTTPTASSGVWKVTVYPQFIVGSISAAETICEGSAPLELIGVAPSGGNIPFSYQWQNSTDNSVFTNISGATTLNFEPGTLTQTTWYRQQQSSANGCGTLITDTVAITVDPTTVGGSVSGDTLVCYGSHTSVLTLSGETGSVLKWQYSTNDVSWVDLTGHTATTYTVEDLVTNTSFRAVVQSGVCLVENSASHMVKVFKNYKISGYAKYDNNPKTPLNGLKILLRKDAVVVDSMATTNLGYYQFDSLTNGSFGLIIKSAQPGGNWQTWSGVNNTDYLLVSKHITGTQLLPVNPPVIRTSASVKIPHPLISTPDATAIRQAAKFPSTGFSYFDIPKWIFSGLDASTRIDTMELNCADMTRDIRGLCAGDVNASYMPPNGFKMAAPRLDLVSSGVLPITRNIKFPVRAERDMELGAITLMLDYDPALIEITDVAMPENGGVEPWFQVQSSRFQVAGTLNLEPETLNLLHVGWMSSNPVNVSAGQTVLMIHARVNNDVVETGLKPVFTDAPTIRFTLNENPLSELADGDGNVIDNAKLSVADAAVNGEMVRWRDGEIGFINVFPNPAKDVLNVEFVAGGSGETQNFVSLQLLTMHGIVIASQDVPDVKTGMNKTTMDLRNLTNGVYMLRVNCGEWKEMKKVVVHK